jgi:M-phase inducer tyrosine phosphatase
MDIDMASPAPFFESSPDGPNALSPLPKSNDFSALFFSPGSPTVQPVPAITSKKRRSCEPEEEELQRVPPPPLASQPQFSSSPPSSPSVNRPNSRTFERSVTTVGQGTLFKPLLKLQQVLPKRTLQARRPTLSVQPTSANPILNGPATAGIVPPVRRAFSAHVQPSDQMAIGGDEVDGDEVDGDETEPEDDSFQGRPLSAHPNIRRKPNFVDGTLVGKSPASSGKKPRLPGFGDNEADGKILPCKKVREDGLMRINCETVSSTHGDASKRYR